MNCLLKFRKILLCKTVYFVIFLCSVLFTFWYISLPRHSCYSSRDKRIVGVIEEITFDGARVKILLQAKEKLLVFYYCSSNDEVIQLKNNLVIGDKLQIDGSLSYPTSSQNFYGFSYTDYLKYQSIYYICQADTILKLEDNTFLLNKIRNRIYQYVDSLSTSQKVNYVAVFFLGNMESVTPTLKQKFQNLGISHLFALSGTQVSLIIAVIQFLLKKSKCQEIIVFLISHSLLFAYYFIISSCASIDRAIVFSIIFSLNRIYQFYIPPFCLILLSVSILLFINPYYIFDIGFQYSTVITSGLILYAPRLEKKNKLLALFKVSCLSFLLSLPISLYHFSWLNGFSILYNLFYVPYINVIVFPLSILVFFLPFLQPVLLIATNLLESSVTFFHQISIGVVVFKRVFLFIYMFYFLSLWIYLFVCRSKIVSILFCCCLLIHFLLPYLESNDRIYMIDVGQGDSFLLLLDHKVCLLDTGGKKSIKKEAWEETRNVFDQGNILIQFIRHLGFNRIDYLILSHGDADHMGEAINLVSNFKVDNVIFNCGEFNELEKELIKVLDKKKIKYYSCIKELNIDNNKLYFLQTKEYDNENDNSNVIYTELDGYKFMFMGDAGVEKERDILKKYNISNIDVLKVGHHGSKTSSGKKFIDEINPKYSIISVGKNNRYGHPNKEVLNNLSDSKIYRTDQDGSIMFNIKKNKLRIKTYSP